MTFGEKSGFTNVSQIGDKFSVAVKHFCGLLRSVGKCTMNVSDGIDKIQRAGEALALSSLSHICQS